jgi:hypothetical protein
MVEEAGTRLNRISFEEVQKAIRASKSLRTAVARFLAQEFGDELAKHFEVTVRKATTKSPRKK